MKTALINAYLKNAACHHYILACISHSKVYAAFTDERAVVKGAYLDKTADGVACIRYKGTAAQDAAKEYAEKFEFIGFKKTVHARAISINVENPNDGDAFESLLFEKYGQPWKYSGNKPFWEGPDIEIDGVGYQIKYIGGTYINEHTLERLNNR